MLKLITVFTYLLAFGASGLVFQAAQAFEAIPNKIILATSQKNNKKPWYAGKNWDIREKLEKTFRKKFRGEPFILEVVHNVEQHDLTKLLSRNDVLAFFWVSHAGKNNETTLGQGNENRVIDLHGNNVLGLFPLIHPQTRFLALVGCNAQKAASEQQTKGLYTHAPQLVLHAKEKKFDTPYELKRAIKDFLNQIRSNTWDFDQPIICAEKKGFELSITRTALLGDKFPSLRVENKGMDIGTLPPFQGPGIQEATFYFHEQIPTKPTDLKVVFNSEEVLEGKMGQISVTSKHFTGKWELFTRPDGSPIGITMNVFRYDGSLTPVSEAAVYHPYSCQ